MTDRKKVYEGPYDGGPIDIPLDGSPVRYLDMHIVPGKVTVFVRSEEGTTYAEGEEAYKFDASALPPREGDG